MYLSTRGSNAVTGPIAIISGIAPDGGLYVPVKIPTVDEQFISSLLGMSYQERALAVLQLFVPEFSKDELERCISSAYSEDKFAHHAVAPLVLLEQGPALLELWHGPTAAFKDMALQLLPQLLSVSLSKTNTDNKIAILVATSGDTGKAALEGFRDVDKTEIIVFYPVDGVSQVQRLQMVTQEGSNVAVIAVDGNFDDAQTGVKNIFADAELKEKLKDNGIRLSSANSINWGRLLPQIVYYFSAYADMVNAGRLVTGSSLNFAVPTGNFGNILAGYYAKLMGLPVGRLICASNQNNVLTDFINSGVYDRNRHFHKTVSPSMDILVSSNLERLLYHITGNDYNQVAAWQQDLNTVGRYSVGDEVQRAIAKLFWADWVNDTTTKQTIATVYNQYQYLLDPHTAVAWHVHESYVSATGDGTPCVIVSTASPFKFCDNVLAALNPDLIPESYSELQLITSLEANTGLSAPTSLASLVTKPILHQQTCKKHEMGTVVKKELID